MTKDEVILLKVWDSAGKIASANSSSEGEFDGVAGVDMPFDFSLHTAFKDSTASPNCPKRNSIEVRTIAFM
jgi:hypothetical protein